MQEDKNKKQILDLDELAKAFIDIQLSEDKDVVAIINNAKITPYGEGGAHVTIPSKYRTGHIAKVLIRKQKAEGTK